MDEHRAQRIALLVAVACVLQISESMLPHPVPGLRLGLASMMTLIALVTLGFGYAVEIAILRTILSSIVIGTFMSPGFILSFSGAVTSALAMGAVYWLSRRQRHLGLSIVGVSVVGALTHNTVQILLAYVLLVRHGGIFAFYPWLCIGAVATGWVTGLIAGGVCRKLESEREREATPAAARTDVQPLVSRHFLPGETFLHRLPAGLKIATVMILALAVLVFRSPWLYAAVLLLVLTAGGLSRISPVFLLSRVRKYTALLVAAFALPLFFNAGSNVLVRAGALRITTEGLVTGGVFATRIVLLMIASTLLVRTTAPEDLTRAFARMLKPLRLFGVSETRTASILSQSWFAIPGFWESARRALRAATSARRLSLREIIPISTDLIAALYMEAEQIRPSVPIDEAAGLVSDVVPTHGGPPVG